MPEFFDSGWIYPSFVAILSASLTATAISFTKSSEIRVLVALFVTIFTFEFHQNISGCLENRLWKALIITAMWLQCLQSLDNLCLTRVSYEPTIKIKSKVKLHNGGIVENRGEFEKAEITALYFSTSSLKRISCGFSMLWNMRAVHTRWSIKNIPPFSANEMNFVPARGNFLLCHFGTILLTSVLLDAFTQLPPPDIENTMAEKHQLFFSRLSKLTVEEFVVRSFAVLGFWLNNACMVSLINSVFAVVHIGLGFQDPICWPPILGKLSEAYSVRRFWGVTWHQSLRRCLTSISEFIVSTVQVPKGGLLSRYLKLFISFGISGILHVVADVVLGIPLEESGALQFFLFTALAIMSEDGTQEITRGVFGKTFSAWNYFFGYMWVIFFMIWSVPTWAYPAARWVRPSQDVLVPFSMIHMVKGLFN